MSKGKLEQIKKLLDDPLAEFDGLTKVQREVGNLASLGDRLIDIAEKLDMEISTAGWHLQLVTRFTKLKKSELSKRLIDRISEIINS